MSKLPVVVAVTLFLIAAVPVFAVPSMVLYGGTYDGDPAEESWIIAPGDDLKAITSYDPSSLPPGYDLVLSFSLGKGDISSPPGSGSITITDIDGNPIVTLTETDFVYGYAPISGAPVPPGGQLPPHAVFPGWFTELSLTSEGFDFLSGLEFEMPDDTDTHYGDGYHFTVDIAGFSLPIYVDFYLTYTDPITGVTSIVDFAPFSKNATLVPEPTTTVLVLTGLFGLAGRGILWRRRH